MKPRENEPCVCCIHWNDKTGCKMGRYHSFSMDLFGCCGMLKTKSGDAKDDKWFF